MLDAIGDLTERLAKLDLSILDEVVIQPKTPAERVRKLKADRNTIVQQRDSKRLQRQARLKR